MIRKLLALAAIATLAASCGGSDTIDDPWGRPTPPSAEVAAFYLTATVDPGDRLVAAESPACGRTELHISQMQDGLMTMRPADTDQLTAVDGTLALEPGGLHVMCMQLVEPLVAGDEIDLAVTFEQAGTFDVKVSIEDR